MATGKSAPKKPAKRSAPRGKGRGGSTRKKAAPPLLDGFREVVSREAVGIAVLAPARP